MTVKACIFDMDGVIVDTAKYHFLAWQRLAESLGIQYTEEHNEQLKGVSRVDSLERILQWGNLYLDPQRKVELMDLKNRWYLELVENINPTEMLDGVQSFLDELKSAGIKIALGSSSKNSIMILDKLNITSYFDAIIDGTKIHLSKPNPEVFLRGAKDLGLLPAECCVFEDALSGVEAAYAGGFQCIGIGSPQALNNAKVTIPSMSGMSVQLMNKLLQSVK